MMRLTRRTTLSIFAAIALAACGSPSETGTPDTSDEPLVLQDIILGDPNAPVTIIEYASWTCAACLDFHDRILPSIQADYIDTGKVRLVFREFPTAPADLSIAGFVVARCAGPDRYYDVVNELFGRQSAFITLAQSGSGVKEALLTVAGSYGIETDEAYQACLNDPANLNAVKASIAAARAKDVSVTPTFVLDGEKLEDSVRISVSSFAAALDEALAETEPAEQ